MLDPAKEETDNLWIVHFPKFDRFIEMTPKNRIDTQNSGKFLQHVHKLQSIVHRNHLPNIADRVCELTSNAQEKCYFKLESINDQRQSLSPKEFSRKKCLSCL
jgi:hypothetical protein